MGEPLVNEEGESSVLGSIAGVIQELGFGEAAAEFHHGALGTLLLASSADAAARAVQDELHVLVPHVLSTLVRVQAATTPGDVSPLSLGQPLRHEGLGCSVPVRAQLLEIWKALPRSSPVTASSVLH